MVEKLNNKYNFQEYSKNVPWYLISSIFTKGMHFFLLPIYTRYLTTEDYGVLANLESYSKLLPIFLSLYLDSAFSRFYFKEKKSKYRIRLMFSSHYWFLLLWGIISSIVLIIFSSNRLINMLGISIFPIVIIVFTSLLNQLSVLVSLIWRAEILAKRIAIFQICTSLIGFFVSLYLLINWNMNWQSRILGTCFMSVVQFLILTYFALKNKWISFQFSKNIIKRSLIFSIPLIPNIAAGWIAGFSDRIIMTFYGRLGEAGIYSVAASFTMLLYILNDAVTQVQGPLSLSGLTKNKKDAKTEMQNFLIVFVGTMSVFYLGLSLFSREILIISTDNQYHIAHKLISILGPIYIFSGVYRIFTVLITFHGMTWWISVAAIFQALINIILNLIFIPVFGMYAAAYSTLISMF